MYISFVITRTSHATARPKIAEQTPYKRHKLKQITDLGKGGISSKKATKGRLERVAPTDRKTPCHAIVVFAQESLSSLQCKSVRDVVVQTRNKNLHETPFVNAQKSNEERTEVVMHDNVLNDVKLIDSVDGYHNLSDCE